MRLRWIAAPIIAFACSVIPLTPAVGQVTQAGQPSAAEMSAFRDLVARHAAAMNQRDAPGVAATFTSDADQIFFDAPVLEGREAIRDALQQALGAWPSSQRFTLVVTGARMLAPNVALVETTATFAEAPLPPNRGTLILVRDREQWLIAALRVYPALKTP